MQQQIKSTTTIHYDEHNLTYNGHDHRQQYITILTDAV